MDDFRRIAVKTVISRGKSRLKVYNPTSYPLIGIGAQGAVFRLTEDKCVKIYEESLSASAERQALVAASGSVRFPRFYEGGEHYVVMEYIRGPALRDVLKKDKSQLNDATMAQVFDILKEMRRMKFTRIDTRLGHILVTPGGLLKAIDHSGAFRVVHRAPFRLLRSMKKVGVLERFLEYAARHEPRLYEKWRQRWHEGGDIVGLRELPPLESYSR